MTVSLICAQQLDELRTLERYAELCGPDGYDRLWFGQSLMLETFSALAALAGSGHRVRCGTAVNVAGLRTPYDAALQARSVASLMGEPLSVSFGLGTPDFAAMLNGGPLKRPGTFSAEYVRAVSTLLNTEEGAARLVPMQAPPIEVGSGVLRPGLARKAGAVADFLSTWLAPLPYITDTIMPAAAEGASGAGRPRAPRIVSIAAAAVARPERNPYKLVFATCGPHLRAAHYQAALRTAGLDVSGDVIRDVQEVAHRGLFIYGSVDTICETALDYQAAGVDEVVLNFSGTAMLHGLDAALEDARAVAAALAGQKELSHA